MNIAISFIILSFSLHNWEPVELFSRVKAILRRTRQGQPPLILCLAAFFQSKCNISHNQHMRNVGQTSYTFSHISNRSTAITTVDLRFYH